MAANIPKALGAGPVSGVDGSPALTGSLGGGQVLAHCFLVLLGPPSISVASLLGEEEPGKFILAEVLERRGLGGSAGVDAADVSCLPAPPPA